MPSGAPPERIAVVDDDEQLAALAHPLRVAILDAMRTPDSAAGVARTIGETRQKTNHHVRRLLDTGLVRLVGERRTGNFVEQLYQSIASCFMVSPRVTWSPERVAALEAQMPLEQLVALGERVQRDSTALLDRATFDGDVVPCLAIDANVTFTSVQDRARFMDDYLELLRPLLSKYGARTGEHYRVAVAVYPDQREPR